MASPFIKALLDAAKTAVNSPQGQAEIESLVSAAESALIPEIDKALAGIPKPGGIAGLVFPSIIAALTSELNAVVQKYTAAEVTALATKMIDDELNALGA